MSPAVICALAAAVFLVLSLVLRVCGGNPGQRAARRERHLPVRLRPVGPPAWQPPAPVTATVLRPAYTAAMAVAHAQATADLDRIARAAAESRAAVREPWPGEFETGSFRAVAGELS